MYGQIVPKNYQHLRAIIGVAPPWHMDQAPHVDFVRRIVDGKSVDGSPYHEYIHRVHGEQAETVIKKTTDGVLDKLKGITTAIEVEAGSVLDGNHRVAVSIVTGCPLQAKFVAPYQTIHYPFSPSIQGRRHTVDITSFYKFSGKSVLELGTSNCTHAVMMARAGARSVIAVDRRLTSSAWEVVRRWKYEEVIQLRVQEIDSFEIEDEYEVVLLMSVAKYLAQGTIERLTKGKDVLFESHIEGDPHPPTEHKWQHIGQTEYSVAEPNRRRDIWLGQSR